MAEAVATAAAAAVGATEIATSGAAATTANRVGNCQYHLRWQVGLKNWVSTTCDSRWVIQNYKGKVELARRVNFELCLFVLAGTHASGRALIVRVHGGITS
jgi:hypothetical protein